jgi:hypothetical protein
MNNTLKYFILPACLLLIILAIGSIRYGSFVAKVDKSIEMSIDFTEKLTFKEFTIASCNKNILLPSFIRQTTEASSSSFYRNSTKVAEISCIENEIDIKASEQYKELVQRTLK